MQYKLFKMIDRKIKNLIEAQLGTNKAIIIMGARQVGKSTLLSQMFDGQKNVLWLNGDETDVRGLFENITSTRLKAIIGQNNLVIIDEAQRITDIGLKLKLITDQISGVQVIATGSSSFDLANKVNESLAGRKRQIQMYPMMFSEMVDHIGFIEEKRMLPHRLVFGYYPEVVTNPGNEKVILKELCDSVLYKDILSLDSVGKPDKLQRLLQALAYQVGSQVSYNELGRHIGLDSKTVERYIDILEKSFIIFRLNSFSRNLRNELKTSRKIYFWDNGIRNAVIGNFSFLEQRMNEEAGMLWENFVISERMKVNSLREFIGTTWFWRTMQQKEIDYIEEENGVINTYEFKWNSKTNAKRPEAFFKAYPDSSFSVITPENIEEFLLIG